MAAKKTPSKAAAPVRAPVKSAPADAPQTPTAAAEGQAPQREPDPAPAAMAPAAPAAPTPPVAPARRSQARASGLYIVGSVPIRHDGKAYGVGHDIELTAAQAERLGDLVAPLPSKE